MACLTEEEVSDQNEVTIFFDTKKTGKPRVEPMYFFGDGDNVGGLIQRAVYGGEMEAARYASRAVSVAIAIIASNLKAKDGVEVWYAGGDDIAFESEFSESIKEFLDEASTLFLSITGTSFSWGIGETPKAAKEALSLAKLSRFRP